jgi:hypothetical protein
MRLSDGQCGLLESNVRRELTRLAEQMHASIAANDLAAVYAAACDVLALIDDYREPTDGRIRRERIDDGEAG